MNILDFVSCRHSLTTWAAVTAKIRSPVLRKNAEPPFVISRPLESRKVQKKGAAYDAATLISASPRPATISAIAFCFSTSLGSMHRESCSGNMRGKLRRQGRASSLTAYTLEIDRGISPKASPDCSHQAIEITCIIVHAIKGVFLPLVGAPRPIRRAEIVAQRAATRAAPMQNP